MCDVGLAGGAYRGMLSSDAAKTHRRLQTSAVVHMRKRASAAFCHVGLAGGAYRGMLCSDEATWF